MTARTVAVIGGGLAGITAAVALREAGLGVTLLEARPWLGGATCSFSRGGLVIDNGQHVFLRCCTAYQELLARLGMTGSAAIQERFDVTVLSGSGRDTGGPGDHAGIGGTAGGAGTWSGPGRARLRRTALPGPLHMGKALAGYSFLAPSERLRVIRGALAMRFADPAAAELDSQRLGDWLAARGQSEQARRRLWDLFIVSALNINGDDASTALAATVIKMALLGGRAAADIGVPAVPLGELHGRAAESLLGRLGADVRLGRKVTAVEPVPAGGFRVLITSPTTDTGADDAGTPSRLADGGPPGSIDGGVISADAVVLAVPHGPAARLVPAGAASGSARWADLGSSPIVNVHVIYDRRVTRLPLVAAIGSPVQWVFDKTRPAGVQAGQYLAVSVSAADSYIDVPVARLRELFLPALEELFPAARDARVTDFFVTRERQATFRQGPGCGSLRPGAATSVPGLALAGAWTNTGWPDTMEGAVRSGHSAAQELISQLTALSAPQQAVPAAAAQPAARVSS